MKAPADFRPERLHRGDWYRESGGEWLVRGTRCRHCRRVAFPPATTCPRCWPADVEETSLPEVGELLTWTVAEIAPAAFRPPYAFGYVDLPGGVRLFGQLEGGATPALAPGMAVRLVLGTVRHDDAGPVWGYKFAPLGDSR